MLAWSIFNSLEYFTIVVYNVFAERFVTNRFCCVMFALSRHAMAYY
jgi:hypothetical protein